MHHAWNGFRERRSLRLREHERYGHAAERATEEILEDLFTNVLDWSVGDLNHQVGYADLLLTRLSIKYLIIEAKRPGSLAWSRPAVERALEQASRYASEQRVQSVAVSDGHMLYAADVVNGGLRDRTYIPLDCLECESDLWWLSVDGIYRVPTGGQEARLQVLGEEEPITGLPYDGHLGEILLHPKYRLPASCFAYVGDPKEPRLWALPYRLAGGAIDAKRLPKAIQAIISNYRGAHVSRIPESAVADVLVRLGRAAALAGKMPWQIEGAAPIYCQLEMVLKQLSRLDDVRPANS
jgi:hypothetical protein